MKNIVIIGGDSGVGFSIAKSLISEAVNLMIVGRNKDKLQKSQKRLGNNVLIVKGDMSTFDGTREIVKDISTKIKNIDVLIDSAGVLPSSEKDNININLLSHLYLVQQIKKYINTDTGRVLLVTGNPDAVNKLPVCENQLSSFQKASWVVTHKTLLMVYLSKELKSLNITVNSFFPGDVKSDLMPYTRLLSNTEVPVGKYLALDNSFEGVNGKFYDDHGMEVPLDRQKYSYENAKNMVQHYVDYKYKAAIEP